MLKPCADCGEPSSSTYCEQHQPKRERREFGTKLSASRRGYGSRWRALSREARRLQPWCSDCGATADLTADHLRFPAFSLQDVDVVCRSCNGKRPPLRGPNGVGSRPRPGEETLRRAAGTGGGRADLRLSPPGEGHQQST